MKSLSVVAETKQQLSPIYSVEQRAITDPSNEDDIIDALSPRTGPRDLAGSTTSDREQTNDHQTTEAIRHGYNDRCSNCTSYSEGCHVTFSKQSYPCKVLCLLNVVIVINFVLLTILVLGKRMSVQWKPKLNSSMESQANDALKSVQKRQRC